MGGRQRNVTARPPAVAARAAGAASSQKGKMLVLLPSRVQYVRLAGMQRERPRHGLPSCSPPPTPTWLLGPMMPPPQLTRAPSLYMACSTTHGAGAAVPRGQGAGLGIQGAAQSCASAAEVELKRRRTPAASPPNQTAARGCVNRNTHICCTAHPPTLKDSTSLANSRWSSFLTAVSATAVAVFLCTTAPSRALPWRAQGGGGGEGEHVCRHAEGSKQKACHRFALHLHTHQALLPYSCPQRQAPTSRHAAPTRAP